jgi:paraquat-inducible protein B
LPAGEVREIGLKYDQAGGMLRPRVEIALFPVSAEIDEHAQEALLRRLVDRRGLRAQLRSASLISGQKYVALDYFPKAPKARLDWGVTVPELPSIRGTLPDFEAKLDSVLTKLDQVPFQEIGDDVRTALSKLDRAIDETSRLVSHVDGEVVPQFVMGLDDARRTLAAAERVMHSVETRLVGPDAPAEQELRSALQEVTGAARALRVLADSLERHPESLIRGRTAQKE